MARGRELEEAAALAAAEVTRLREQLPGAATDGATPDAAALLQARAERDALAQQLSEVQAALADALQAQRAALAQATASAAEAAAARDAAAATTSAHSASGAAQLEAQLAELQELLLQRQQQLERLAADKQASQLVLERQIASLRAELGRAHADAAAATAAAASNMHMSRGAGSGASFSSHDIIPMDALGEPYARLARHRKLGGAVTAAAGFLDRTAATASTLLRQRPLARLGLFAYLLLLHAYVYMLIARMQRQALLLSGPHGSVVDGSGRGVHELPGGGTAAIGQHT